MKNKFNRTYLGIVIVTLVFLGGCSSSKNKIEKTEDPLLLPPHFSEMPDVNSKNQTKPQPADPDVKKLKDLLLQN